MNKDEEKLMSHYGITCSSKMLYFYKQYRYENITDALNFAEIDNKRTQNNVLLVPGEDVNT